MLVIAAQVAAGSAAAVLVVALDDASATYHLPGCSLYEKFSHRMPESAAVANGYRLHLGCATSRPRRPRASWPPLAEWNKDATHVLFVGNSLTYFNEMPWMVSVLAKSRGLDVRAHFVGRSGATLEDLWREKEALFRIREKRWDYVVIQDQSLAPILRLKELSEYARRFRDVIVETGARPLLFLTWAHSDQWHLQQQYDQTYLALGESLHMTVAPVGVAWERVKRRSPDVQLHDGSTMHPTLAGTYLTACVFFAVISGDSPVGLPYVFDLPFTTHEFYRESLMNDRLDETTARFLQENATAVVEKLSRHRLHVD